MSDGHPQKIHRTSIFWCSIPTSNNWCPVELLWMFAAWGTSTKDPQYIRFLIPRTSTNWCSVDVWWTSTEHPQDIHRKIHRTSTKRSTRVAKKVELWISHGCSFQHPEHQKFDLLGMFWGCCVLLGILLITSNKIVKQWRRSDSHTRLSEWVDSRARG